MALKKWPNKDPQERLDYTFDWSPRGFPDDVITVFTATVTEGDVQTDGTEILEGGSRTLVWLKAGTDGTTCKVLLHAETSDNRIFEETIQIKIKSK